MLRSLFFKSKDEAKDAYLSYKIQIQSHLEALHVSPQAIKTILNAVDHIPNEHLQVICGGALAFLTELTDKQSQCEDHYVFSDNIAEFFCTMTNIGFFAVAFYYKDYAALLAGTFSALSHAIPLKRLNELDKIAAINVFCQLLYNHDVLLNSTSALMASLTTITMAGLDLAIRRNLLQSLEKHRALFHSAWHISAAYTLHQFNQVNLAHGDIMQSWFKVLGKNMENITKNIFLNKR